MTIISLKLLNLIFCKNNWTTHHIFQLCADFNFCKWWRKPQKILITCDAQSMNTLNILYIMFSGQFKLINLSTSWQYWSLFPFVTLNAKRYHLTQKKINFDSFVPFTNTAILATLAMVLATLVMVYLCVTWTRCLLLVFGVFILLLWCFAWLFLFSRTQDKKQLSQAIILRELCGKLDWSSKKVTPHSPP